MNCEELFKLGLVGATITGVEIKITDVGEILTLRPHIMKGYYKNSAATAEMIDNNGWLSTGDIGFLDENGFLHITDRKKKYHRNIWG